MNNGFFEALSLLGSENSVDTEIIVEKVKSALLKAIRKSLPPTVKTIYAWILIRRQKNLICL